MTKWLGNISGKYANRRQKAERTEYSCLATSFIYNELNAICVELLENNSSCIQQTTTFYTFCMRV